MPSWSSAVPGSAVPGPGAHYWGSERRRRDRYLAWGASPRKTIGQYRQAPKARQTIQASSEAAKKKPTSIAAFSGESEPWMAFRSMDSP